MRVLSLFRTDRIIKIPKHLRYVISSVFGAVALFLAAGVPYEYLWIALILLVMLSYVLTWFALLEDIKGVEWLLLFLVPMAWTACWYVFFYLIPMRFAVRLGLSLAYPFIFYVLISAMNIFNVGVEKSLQLHRAAQAANIFIVTFVYYLFAEVLLPVGLPWYLFIALTMIFTYFVSLQVFWSNNPGEGIRAEVIYLARYASIVMGFFSFLFYLLPFAIDTARSVLLGGTYYVLTNLLSTYTDNVLWKQRLREFVIVLVILILTILVTLRW